MSWQAAVYNGRDFYWSESQERSGDGTSRERTYFVVTADRQVWDELDVFDAGRAVVCPSSVAGFRLDPADLGSAQKVFQLSGLSVDEMPEQAGAYKLVAKYGPQADPTPVKAPDAKVPEVGEASYQYDVSLETVTILRSNTAPTQFHPKFALDLAAAEGFDPATLDVDLANGINIDKDGEPQGIDILVPVSNFTIRYAAPTGRVTEAYRRQVEDLVGKVNSDTYLGRPPGSLLFTGVNGQERLDGSWDLSFSLRYRENVTAVEPIVFGTGDNAVTITEKDGWDALWVQTYSYLEPTTQKIERYPEVAFVHKVYPRANFAMDTTPDPGPLPPIGTVDEG